MPWTGWQYRMGYDSRGETIRSPFTYKLINASAGLVSTVRDLGSFDAAIDRHLLLKPETRALAWQPAVTSNGGTLPYALGWYSQRTAGRRIINFIFNVPAGIEGRRVPVVVKVDGVVGNYATMAITASGKTCSDPVSLPAAPA